MKIHKSKFIETSIRNGDCKALAEKIAALISNNVQPEARQQAQVFLRHYYLSLISVLLTNDAVKIKESIYFKVWQELGFMGIGDMDNHIEV